MPQLVAQLDQNRQRQVENVRQAAAALFAAPSHRHVIDHGPAHADRVVALLDGLTEALMVRRESTRGREYALAPDEIYILLSSAYLHAIGLQDEPSEPDADARLRRYPELSAELIYRAIESPQAAADLGLLNDPSLIEMIALVVERHRATEYPAPAYDDLPVGNVTVRPRLLAALLHFADSLDLDCRRVDLEQLKLMSATPDEALAWWQHHYVSGVQVADEYVRIGYRVPLRLSVEYQDQAGQIQTCPQTVYLSVAAPEPDSPLRQRVSRPTSAGITREVDVERTSGPAVTVGPIRNRWALLVGINGYVDPAFPPLKFCVNDVLTLEQMLKSLGYTVVTLHDDAKEERLLPTRENVEAELSRLCQVVEADDLLLAHLACHGKLVEGKPVLITREIRAPTLARKALSLSDIETLMRASKARRLVLMLDACHTGVEVGRDLGDPQFIKYAYDLAEGFALIAASTAQQIAQEWDEKRHGVFSYYLLEGLSGKADRDGKRFVTVDDLKTHVLDGLRRWNVEHGGLLQEPTARTEGLGDIVLADYRNQSRSPQNTADRLNPFGDRGRINDLERFFDRQQLVREIQQLLLNRSCVSLVGPSEMGKSSLLYYLYLSRAEWQANVPVEYFDLQRILDETDFCETVLLRLGHAGNSLRDLKRVLERERVVLLLDEVERLAEPEFHPRLHDLLRSLAQEPTLAMVVTTQRPLVEVFPPRGTTSPFHNVFTLKQIGPFTPAEARAFLEHRLAGTGVTFSAMEMDDLIERSGGYPARLQEAAYQLFAEKG